MNSKNQIQCQSSTANGTRCQLVILSSWVRSDVTHLNTMCLELVHMFAHLLNHPNFRIREATPFLFNSLAHHDLLIVPIDIK